MAVRPVFQRDGEQLAVAVVVGVDECDILAVGIGRRVVERGGMIGGVVVGRVLFRNSLADSGPQLIVVAVELSPQEVEGDVVRAKGLGVLMGHLPGDGEGFERGEDGDLGAMELNTFINKICEEIRTKSLTQITVD